MNFKTFAFHPAVARGIDDAGYANPTPIQQQAMPAVIDGRDVMGLAQTGTGKTAAFALPILHRLMCRPRKGVSALIIAPTRELAEQIHMEFQVLGRHTGLRSAVVYGGVGINPQIRVLERAHIVVGCPGRLLDHLGRGTLDLSHLAVLVLDEADQMFDMGFLPDIRRILGHIAAGRQTLLFSATMPADIRSLASEILRDPVTVHIGSTAPAQTVKHALFPVAAHLKTALLIRLLAHANDGSVLVFTRTKHRARSLGEKLVRAGFRSTSLQGNLSQGRRQAAMNGFRSGEFQVLVATDIAARGIDVRSVSHVINYDVPTTPEVYIHRIGRTGRAECSGDAYTLITGEDAAMVRAINRAVGSNVEQRILEDFDYGQPSAAGSGRAAGDRARRKAETGKGGDTPQTARSRTTTRRRDGKGAFAWLSPQPRRRTGDSRRAKA